MFLTSYLKICLELYRYDDIVNMYVWDAIGVYNIRFQKYLLGEHKKIQVELI